MIAAASSPTELCTLAKAVGLVILAWQLPRPVGGLYFHCPAQAIRTLLVSKLLGGADRERVVAQALSLPVDSDTAELILA